MSKRNRMFVDQYGGIVWARTAKELREKVGGRLAKLYHDGPKGSVLHVGYVVGSRWFREYAAVEKVFLLPCTPYAPEVQS